MNLEYRFIGKAPWKCVLYLLVYSCLSTALMERWDIDYLLDPNRW